VTLDEAERLARDATNWRDIDTGEPEWARAERLTLARALLAVLPVVRAAEAWRDADARARYEASRALDDAVDAMRSVLAGEP